MSLHPFLPTAEAEQKASRFPIPASSAVVFAAAAPLAETESTFSVPRVGRVEAAAKGQDWHAAEAVECGFESWRKAGW
ncbi:hypothetical protein GW17_00031810, partial [Ensete ventricosum]